MLLFYLFFKENLISDESYHVIVHFFIILTKRQLTTNTDARQLCISYQC